MNSTIEKLNQLSLNENIREDIITFLKLLVNQKENIKCSPTKFYEMSKLNCGLDIFIQKLKELGIWSFKTINIKKYKKDEKEQIIYKINIDVLENHLKRFNL